jgi:hypothetical protein
VLKKAGVPDVHFELRRTAASDFEMLENDRVVGIVLRAENLRETWDECVAKRYPGYEVSKLEEWIPE